MFSSVLMLSRPAPSTTFLTVAVNFLLSWGKSHYSFHCAPDSSGYCEGERNSWLSLPKRAGRKRTGPWQAPRPARTGGRPQTGRPRAQVRLGSVWPEDGGLLGSKVDVETTLNTGSINFTFSSGHQHVLLRLLHIPLQIPSIHCSCWGVCVDMRASNLVFFFLFS